jgi:hypothetical protein
MSSSQQQHYQKKQYLIDLTDENKLTGRQIRFAKHPLDRVFGPNQYGRPDGFRISFIPPVL